MNPNVHKLNIVRIYYQLTVIKFINKVIIQLLEIFHRL
jgi:hypothetical protein